MGMEGCPRAGSPEGRLSPALVVSAGMLPRGWGSREAGPQAQGHGWHVCFSLAQK